MKVTAITSRTSFILVALFTFIVSVPAHGQNIRKFSTDGTTTPVIEPGAPTGSFALSGFDNVNLFNGNLNFSLPLLKIGGRGSAGFSLGLKIEKKWRVEYYRTPTGYQSCGQGCVQPIWGPQGQHYYPNPNWWSPDPGFGPGILVGRWGGISRGSCTIGGPGGSIITTLTFITNDGSEIVLPDDLTNGQPTQLTSAYCSSNIGNRGVNWHSVNGEGATFISDTVIRDSDMTGEFYPSGYLMTRDGTRSRIDNGNVTWMRDRNGNKVSFTYGGIGRMLTATDSLNRQISISYGSPSPTIITFSGFGGMARTIEIGYDNLGNVLRYDQSLKTYQQLWPDLPEGGSAPFNPTETPSYVKMPDDRYYYFKYNSYRELARIELPTGGAIDYDWGGMIWLTWPDANTTLKEIRRWVTEKRIYPDGGTGSNFTTRQTFSSSQGSSPTTGTLTTYDSNNNVLSYEIHSYFGGNFLPSNSAEYPPYTEGKESGNTVYNGVTAVRSTSQTWQNRAHVTWYTLGYATEPVNDPRVTDVVTTLGSSNLVSKVHTDYDDSYPYNNPKDVWEYDYGTGAPGALIRRTRTDYAYVVNGVNYATDPTIHLRGLPSQQQIFDAGGTERARTTYEYDNYANDGNRAPLVDRPGTPGFDSSFTTSYTKRGNVTKISRWLLPSTEIASYPRYDIAGNVVAAKDPNGKVSQTGYSSAYGYAMPTSQITPVPDPSGTYGSSTAFTTTMVYDFWTGKVTSVTDPNNQTTTYEYNDTLDRLTRVVRPSGGGETVYQYGNTVGNLYLRTQTKRDASNWIDQYAYFDGLGRTKRTALYEGPGSWSLADTEYDSAGRVRRVTNPYRAASATGATPTEAEWTTTTYDALSRVLSVTTPDGAVVRTAYQGNRVMVGDQAGKKRMSETDAVGRLINVWEITSPSAGETQITFTGSTSSDLNGTYNANPTAYQYDVVGNLRKVTQATQTRFFAYDSLSRLIRARNPEQNVNAAIPAHTDPVTGNSQWSLSYSYDSNGNLYTKTDPLNITTTFVYDALNRNTQVTYSSYPNGSYSVQRYYDAAVNGKGRLWYEISNNYRWEKPTDNLAYHYTGVNNYDALGRPLNHSQNFLVLEGGSWQWKSYNLSRTYDLAGNCTAQTYPSGRTVNYAYDSAGRLNSFTGNLGGIAGVNYATGIQYNGYGLTSRETYGTQTPLALNLHYNNRLQTVDLRLGLNSGTEWDWSRGALTFYYGTAAINEVNPFKNSPDNNGNVLRQMNYVPLSAGGYVMPQIDDYLYDPLNRIQQVSEAQQSSAGQVSFLFTQKYAYDRWGNRTIDLPGTTPSIPGVTRKTFVVNTATNRLTSSDGCAMTYDAAGNQTYDCVGTHYYDAENRMTKAVQGSSNNYYFYDASGKRVRRILNGSQTWGGQETWFVYGFDGELVAEYAYNQLTAPLATAPQKEYGYRGGKLLVVWDGTQAGDDQLKWLVTDHLGSTRMEANKSGSLAGIRRHDYLPFGEELAASTGAQRGGVGYEPPQSSVRQRFTGKERDIETGFDWFGPGRYYTSSQGRFVSLDPGGAGVKRSNPQTWNHYTYTLNRPTIAIDPDGLSTIVVTVTIPANGGNPTATILFSGRIVQNGGEGAVLYNGLAAGQGRNRLVENNDTPYGIYRFDGTEGGTADSRLGRGYGTGKINLTGLAGEIIDSGRTLIRLHGGGSALGDRAYDLSQELRPTLGCVRMHNGNVNALISLIGIAAANQDPLDRVFIGNADTLNTIANQRDRYGNYVNPGLRLALGMWNSDQEYQDLLTADANRRSEIQRQREEDRERQEQERRLRRRRQRGNQ